MDPSVGWNSLLMGLSWLKLCSNGSRLEGLNQKPAGLNWYFGAMQIFLIFSE